MLKQFKADLHIHSCLSPCAELDMTPSNIVKKAHATGIDIIAISDHNSAENVGVTIDIAKEHDITVLPAMEITTSEEVHLLALFDDLEACLSVQHEVQRSMSTIPLYKHDETSQPIVNENDEVLSFNPLPLINATAIPLASLVDLIHDNHGLAIASHIDKEAFSIISQLGFIPPRLPLDAVEVSCRILSNDEVKHNIINESYPILSFSDAHHISDIGRRVTTLYMNKSTINEIELCLAQKEGRKYEILF